MFWCYCFIYVGQILRDIYAHNAERDPMVDYKGAAIPSRDKLQEMGVNVEFKYEHDARPKPLRQNMHEYNP